MHPPHSHDHHTHAPADFGRAFLIGTALNLAFVLVEAAYGFMAHSMALIADAGHNLSDVLGLVAAWGAASLVKRAPSRRFTYGLRKSSVLAALFNAVVLLVAVGAIALEAVRRFSDPESVATGTVMAVAGVGIVINGFTAWMFASGRKGDLNIRGAYLHMAADAGLSAGVVVTGLIMARTGWLWLDPAVSLAIVAVILFGTWGLLRDSVAMALDAVPEGIELGEVAASLGELPGVARVHDLHIWPISTTEAALTCHLFIPRGQPGDNFLHYAAAMLRERFDIKHTTIQIEVDPGDDCHQAPAGSL
jgi:cobalt-zinc-cadmium efflux system protein